MIAIAAGNDVEPLARPATVGVVFAMIVVAHFIAIVLLIRSAAGAPAVVVPKVNVVAVDVSGPIEPDEGPSLRRGTANGTTGSPHSTHGGHAPRSTTRSSHHPTTTAAIDPTAPHEDLPALPGAATPSPTAPEATEESPTPAPSASSDTPVGPPDPSPSTDTSSSPSPIASASAAAKGDERGSDDGDDPDPLRAHAVASYKGELDRWFAARFHIRGKLPFDRLKTLRATVVVRIDGAHHVASFTLVSPSGEPIFDGQLRSDLSAIQGSGVELPGPPPAYPDLLPPSVTLGFSCSVQSRCE